MIPLWAPQAERIALGTGAGAAFALKLPAQSAPTERPIVLVHGFRGAAMEWGPLASYLARSRDV